MLRNHIGFASFMLLLLIAPKVPFAMSGGAARSSVSLGIAGLVFWYLTYPNKLFCFPKINISHPLCWLIIFAIYTFIISFLSTNIVSIAYSVQFLAYAVFGTILMRRYARSFISSNSRHARSNFFVIAIIYSVGILISVFTGPIYPYLVKATQRHWAGLTIQQGVGFAESQNLAGPVAMFFTAACIYLYHGKIWKKWILLILFLLALLATLSRGVIISFLLAMAFVYCLDNLVPFIKRGKLKVSALKNIGFVMLALSFIVSAAVLVAYAVNKTFLIAILSGFGLTSGGGSILSDMVLRFDRWQLGLNTWASGDFFRMVFGGGFRSSMTVVADYGIWKDAHNVYITILGDFGVVGLLLFVTALVMAFFHYARLFLTDRAQPIDKFGLLVLLCLSIDNMTGPYFYSPVCLSLLIFTLANLNNWRNSQKW